MTATMIIKFTPKVLEFADANGKSLGKFQCLRAEAVLDDVAKAGNDDALRLQRTQNYYEQLSSPEEVTTPGDGSTGFERTT